MESKRNEILQLIDQLNANTMSQKLMDETYSRFCNIVKDKMENNLPKSSNRKHHHHKPWWNQELSEARKGVTKAEREWLTCNSGMNRPILRVIIKLLEGSLTPLFRGQRGVGVTRQGTTLI